jgi:hypothetical protein
MSEHNPFDRVVEPWEAVTEDMEATAEEYREAGWEVLELHPGDVTVLDGERYGLDVLVPGNEYEPLTDLAAAGTFDSYEVYRAEEAGIAFVLAVLEDQTNDQAVCCPAYYDESEADEMARRAHAEGRMYTHIRPLANDEAVTFAYEDPDLFFAD